LKKDKAALEAHIARTDAVLKEIGGRLTEEQAHQLILKKIYDIAYAELNRYLSAEKRALITGVENLWDKYAVSMRGIESVRDSALSELNGFLLRLEYLVHAE